MTSISGGVSGDVRNVVNDMRHRLGDQTDYAAALAITWTAQDVKKAEEKLILREIDRPTPFTQRAVGIRRATKNRQVGWIFLKDIQAEYLGLQVEGGTRTGTTGFSTPANIRLNKFGNIPGLKGGRKINALLAKPNHFRSTIGGVDGIWKRERKGRVELVIRFLTRATYQKRLHFYETAHNYTRAKFPRNFDRAGRRAIETKN